MPKKIQHYIIALLFFALNTEGVATPILERTVTLKVQNKTIGEVLKSISDQAQFLFSYNTNIINADKKVNLNVSGERVRVVLKELLGAAYQFKEKGNYLIIQRLKRDEQIISGYVRDKNTGEKLKNVTVYDKKTLVSATTDSTGYYEIITRKPIQQLSIARVNYGDTILQVRSLRIDTPPDFLGTGQYLDIAMIPTADKVSVEVDVDIEDREADKKNDDPYAERTLFSNKEVRSSMRYVVSTFQRANDRNITEDLHRLWHISLAPYVGTNLGLSGNVVNDISINATVGYSKGNRKLELGGIGNINLKTMRGLQVGGVFNVVNGEAKGVQASGIINRAKDMRGLQITGITNTTDFLKNSLQISGINNHTDNANGGVFQVAGMVNKSEKGRTALQIAAITNQADTVGVQIGLINSANRVRGLQIGLINKSDTADGIVLGLLNIVKKGYHVLEIAANNDILGTIAYKTGTKHFYSIYAFGGQPEIKNRAQILSFGTGFGTFIPIYKAFGITLDATVHRVRVLTYFDNKGVLLRLSPALNIQLRNKTSLFLSPVWNNYYLKNDPLNMTNVLLLKQNMIPEKAVIKGNWATWWGWQVGVRF